MDILLTLLQALAAARSEVRFVMLTSGASGAAAEAAAALSMEQGVCGGALRGLMRSVVHAQAGTN